MLGRISHFPRRAVVASWEEPDEPPGEDGQPDPNDFDPPEPEYPGDFNPYYEQ